MELDYVGLNPQIEFLASIEVGVIKSRVCIQFQGEIERRGTKEI